MSENGRNSCSSVVKGVLYVSLHGKFTSFHWLGIYASELFSSASILYSAVPLIVGYRDMFLYISNWTSRYDRER